MKKYLGLWIVALLVLCAASAWAFPTLDGISGLVTVPTAEVTPVGTVDLAAGDYEFVGTIEPGVGEFQLCSLFSPVLEFEDQATARFVAQHARAALLDARCAQTGHRLDPVGGGSVHDVQARLQPPLAIGQ